MRAPLQVEGIAVQHQVISSQPTAASSPLTRLSKPNSIRRALTSNGRRPRRAASALANAFVQRGLQAREQHRQPAASTNNSTYSTASVTWARMLRSWSSKASTCRMVTAGNARDSATTSWSCPGAR
jgi:hypothetical protein